MRFQLIAAAAAAFALSGCGVIYHSPTVQSGATDSSQVRVLPITAENALLANQVDYQPRSLPAVFSQYAGGGSLRGAGALPEPVFEPEQNPGQLNVRIPPAVNPGPYRIGVGDVLLLATQSAGSTVEELSGLLAAQNRRQGYTVQDDGVIAIPDVGRVGVAGLTLEEAEAELFRRLVENQIDPTFSLEIAEFNSKKVSIGGAVSKPTVAPITLTPLFLDAALAAAGGVTASDLDYASVRIYRAGTLYQIPLSELYARTGLRRVQLVDGDSVFVDTEYDLEQAQSYFEEQIQLAQFKQSSRQAALAELDTEISIRRASLQEQRENFDRRFEYGGVERDYVYLTGEVRRQSRFALPFGHSASLADALFDNAGGLSTTFADVRQIYVLRGSPDPREFSGVTAWQLDASNAANLLLATRFELRPNDVVFVSEQPVTRWNRTISQIIPTLGLADTATDIGN